MPFVGRTFLFLALLTVPMACAQPRYLALGDSYTIGESVPPAERFPEVLAKRLALGPPQVIARTGWTTGDLAGAIAEARPGSRYDLVTLLIGVNDQYRGGDAAAYRGHFDALLQQAIGFARGKAGRVIVVSIPDWGATPFAEGRDRAKIGREIDAFNAVNREETLKAGARYVDITPLSRQTAHDATLTAPDGLHPSGALYAKWVDALEPAARAAVKAE